MSTNNQILANAQNSTQAQEWFIEEYDSKYEYVENYETSTGHSVKVHTLQNDVESHVHIEVYNDTGIVDACDALFKGANHMDVSNRFVEDYLQSPDLQNICADFDEICCEHDPQYEEYYPE